MAGPEPGARDAPVIVRSAVDLDRAAMRAHPTPSEPQKAAGNYPMGHAVLPCGLCISIETARGQKRSGTDPDGEPWETEMPAHYGYAKRSEGADGDGVDLYAGPNPHAPIVFVIDQIDPADGSFDEHKAMLGFKDRDHALSTYDAGFSDGTGPLRRGAVTPMSRPDFRALVSSGPVTKPLAYTPDQAAPALVAGLLQMLHVSPDKVPAEMLQRMAGSDRMQHRRLSLREMNRRQAPEEG
jgi:hypothetical protein